MLSKQDTAVLILAILVTWGITPKSLASSKKVNFNSVLEDKQMVLSLNNRNEDSFFSNLEKFDGAILAQNESSADTEGTDTASSSAPVQLWWLAPLIVLAPFLGFLAYKSGSKAKQVNQKQVVTEDNSPKAAVSSSNPSKLTSELELDSSIVDRPIQADTAIATAENPSVETIQTAEVKGQVQEFIPNTQTQAEIDSLSTSDREQLLETSPSSEVASTVQEETIVEPVALVREEELESISVEDKNLDDGLLEKSTTSETITSSQSTLSTAQEELETQGLSEQAEPITDRDLANISEWLNEKIDSDDKDISVMDDFWDNLSSITEEINSEEAVQTEPISDRELANISEWLNEKVNTKTLQDDELDRSLLEDSNITSSENSAHLETNLDSNVNDSMVLDLDDLSNLVEDEPSDSEREQILSNDNRIDREEESELNGPNKEGISDLTSNFLEDFLNEDSNREHKS